jgi:hypothetical protein
MNLRPNFASPSFGLAINAKVKISRKSEDPKDPQGIGLQ